MKKRYEFRVILGSAISEISQNRIKTALILFTIAVLILVNIPYRHVPQWQTLSSHFVGSPRTKISFASNSVQIKLNPPVFSNVASFPYYDFFYNFASIPLNTTKGNYNFYYDNPSEFKVYNDNGSQMYVSVFKNSTWENFTTDSVNFNSISSIALKSLAVSSCVGFVNAYSFTPYYIYSLWSYDLNGSSSIIINKPTREMVLSANLSSNAQYSFLLLKERSNQTQNIYINPTRMNLSGRYVIITGFQHLVLHMLSTGHISIPDLSNSNTYFDSSTGLVTRMNISGVNTQFYGNLGSFVTSGNDSLETLSRMDLIVGSNLLTLGNDTFFVSSSNSMLFENGKSQFNEPIFLPDGTRALAGILGGAAITLTADSWLRRRND